MKIFSLLLALLMILPASSEAQFDKLKEKLGGKKKENKDKKKNKEPVFDLSQIVGGGDVELNDSYNFDFTVSFKVTSSDTKEPVQITQMYNRDETYFGMKITPEEKGKGVEEAIMIIDVERSYTIMITEEEMQALVMAYQNPDQHIYEYEDDELEKNFKMTKTNKTKYVLKYLCNQRLFSGDSGSGEIWTTSQIDYKGFDMYTHFQEMNKKKSAKQSDHWSAGLDGFMLHVKGVDEEGEEFEMIATDVNEKADVSYEMDQYKVVDLSKFGSGYQGDGDD